ncbi:MAG TPA: hypothetical protein PKC76_12130 [Saprospiraceae bacterium]|nr:hypothetical protein [Saprospiraceae bacterium]HMP24877.1 hypothetical protein [Saprospiraceae bacterium]
MKWRKHLLFDLVILIGVIFSASFFYQEIKIWHFPFSISLGIIGFGYLFFLLIDVLNNLKKTSMFAIIIFILRIIFLSILIYISFILAFFNMGEPSPFVN